MYKLDEKSLYFPKYQAIVKLKDVVADVSLIEKELQKYREAKHSKGKGLRKYFQNLAPLTVHIFPTSDCNLRCKYCFSDAGKVSSSHLSKEQINAMLKQGAKAVYIIKKAALATGMEEPVFEIWFGGGGEPTFLWEMFVYTIERASEFAKKYDISVQFGMLTNGAVSDPEKIRYILENVKYVQVSYDGTREIQNLQRPMAGGKDSFERVDTFVDELMQYGTLFALRSTVSESSVTYLPEITEFFCRNYPGATHIHFEPITSTDRSVRNQFSAPRVDEFVKYFLKAMEIGKQFDKAVLTSLFGFEDIRQTESFCDAMIGDTVMLQPNGYLTTCYEAMPYELDEYSIFKAGEISPDGVVNWYGERNVETFQTSDELCEDCFCWESCKGECAMVRYRGAEGHRYRCSSKRNITKQLLVSISEGKDQYRLFANSTECEDSVLIDKIYYWDDTVLGTRKARLSEL